MERAGILMPVAASRRLTPFLLRLLAVRARQSADLVPRRAGAGAAACADAGLFLVPGAARSDAAGRGVRASACWRICCPAGRPASGPPSFVAAYALIDRQRDLCGACRPRRRARLCRGATLIACASRLCSSSRSIYLARAAASPPIVLENWR